MNGPPLRKPNSPNKPNLILYPLSFHHFGTAICFLHLSTKKAGRKQKDPVNGLLENFVTVMTCVKNIELKYWSTRLIHKKMQLWMHACPVPLTEKVSCFAGGVSSCNFWTSCLNPIKNYIFEILFSRAVDRYMHGSNRRGGVWSP
jgi:hypothetical protein